MFRSNLLQHLVHCFQGWLSQSVDLRPRDISEVDRPTNLMVEVLGLQSPLVGLEEGPDWF